MATFTDFWKFIQGKLMGGKEYRVTSADLEEYVDMQKWNELALYEFHLNAGINIIANALACCETRTFSKFAEHRGDQYYRWNFEPNKNQNAVQFMHKLVWTLIYKNECLVIQTRTGELLIADSFTHEQYALYPDVFTNVTVCEDVAGTPNPYTFPQRFHMQDVLYYQLSNRNITGLLNSLVQEYNNLLQSAITKFYKSGGERGILTIDANAPNISYGKKADGTPRTFNDVYAELMQKQFAEYFKNANAVLPLFKGMSYETKGTEASKKSTSEIKDVIDIDDRIVKKVGNALQIPPQLLLGDLADVAGVTKNALSFGIDPFAKLIETENNRKFYGTAVLKGDYQMIDTSRIIHMSASEIAAAGDKMIGSGAWCIDDVRRMAGDAPLNTEESKRHFITKNYGAIGEGGTDNAG